MINVRPRKEPESSQCIVTVVDEIRQLKIVSMSNECYLLRVICLMFNVSFILLGAIWPVEETDVLCV